MNHRRSLLVAVGLVLALVAGAVAEESKFSLSNYIPFMGKSSSTDKNSTVRSNTTAKKTATSKKAVKSASHKKSSEPSMWQKVSNGTKSTFSKLNPWSSDKSKTNKTASTKTASTTSGKPRTVSEFIKQPRPE